MIQLRLGHSRRSVPNKQQYAADETCLERFGQAIVAGDVGPQGEAAQECYDKAAHFRKVADVPIARFLTWFKQRLGENGHAWNETANAL